MEKSYRFALADYYRDLQTVQKNLSHTNNDNKKIQKPLEQKTQLSIKGIRQSIYESKRDETKNKKLIIGKKKIQQPTYIKNNKQIDAKYLESMDEGLMNKKYLFEKSSPTKQYNPKITLQIQGFDEGLLTPVKNEGKGLLKDEKMKDQLKKQTKRLQDPRRSINEKENLDFQDKLLLSNKVQNRKTESETLTDSLLEVLRHRNNIYELFKRNCKVNIDDYEKQFERIWQKSLLYKKLVERINLLLKTS